MTKKKDQSGERRIALEGVSKHAGVDLVPLAAEDHCGDILAEIADEFLLEDKLIQSKFSFLGEDN